MPATKLTTIRVDKPWGRKKLWPGFDNDSGAQTGEIWFEAPKGTDPDLMVKYLFTSEKLSIQVHEDDASAHAVGHERGKDEAWVILGAEPDSTIGLGLHETVSGEALRAAALDGSIETLVDWKPVHAGEVIYSPARTIHAIGAGLTVIEVQQNVDLTYRLYDYGRPRELHLDKGIAVSDPKPFKIVDTGYDAGAGRKILCEGGKFVMERWSWDGARDVTMPDRVPGWLIPITGGGTVDGTRFEAGEGWMVNGGAALVVDAGSDLLFAYPLADAAPILG
ncbi:phosphoheptose isomerase [Sphingomonas paeninsulae]|jgi:mannose-6-phosphate isomerase|uniref:Phosphoheptose isomerase n=1 Tax=Sphingomonas paeninsulae TaxID=2319844 RepID=A0A494TNX6_SPHPE|nr:class I mannose-6-phosphate isomerase [Sphingomonas paeninsulae]AYJ87178.1 phosphoheptose isomerase [Sphingomonas paeninsulae]